MRISSDNEYPDFVFWDELDHLNAHRFDMQQVKDLSKIVKKNQLANAKKNKTYYRLEGLLPAERKSSPYPTKQMVLDDVGDYIEQLKERNEELETANEERDEETRTNNELEARIEELESKLSGLQLFHDSIVKTMDEYEHVEHKKNKPK